MARGSLALAALHAEEQREGLRRFLCAQEGGLTIRAGGDVAESTRWRWVNLRWWGQHLMGQKGNGEYGACDWQGLTLQENGEREELRPLPGASKTGRGEVANFRRGRPRIRRCRARKVRGGLMALLGCWQTLRVRADLSSSPGKTCRRRPGRCSPGRRPADPAPHSRNSAVPRIRGSDAPAGLAAATHRLEVELEALPLGLDPQAYAIKTP